MLVLPHKVGNNIFHIFVSFFRQLDSFLVLGSDHKVRNAVANLVHRPELEPGPSMWQMNALPLRHRQVMGPFKVQHHRYETAKWNFADMFPSRETISVPFALIDTLLLTNMDFVL